MIWRTYKIITRLFCTVKTIVFLTLEFSNCPTGNLPVHSSHNNVRKRPMLLSCIEHANALSVMLVGLSTWKTSSNVSFVSSHSSCCCNSSLVSVVSFRPNESLLSSKLSCNYSSTQSAISPNGAIILQFWFVVSKTRGSLNFSEYVDGKPLKCSQSLRNGKYINSMWW